MFELQSRTDSRSFSFWPPPHLSFGSGQSGIRNLAGRRRPPVNSQCTHSCRIEIALSTLKSQIESYFRPCPVKPFYLTLFWLIPIINALIDRHWWYHPCVSLIPPNKHPTNLIKLSKRANFSGRFHLNVSITCILLLLTNDHSPFLAWSFLKCSYPNYPLHSTTKACKYLKLFPTYSVQ